MSRCPAVVHVVVVAGSLLLAGCDEPPRDGTQTTAAATVSPEPDSVAPLSPDEPSQPVAPVAGTEPAPAPPAATAGRSESAQEERALDLSLPPQVELGSLEVLPSTPSRLLPDLFDPERASVGSALSLKGRLFTNEEQREDLDAIEGGEITLEVKTR